MIKKWQFNLDSFKENFLNGREPLQNDIDWYTGFVEHHNTCIENYIVEKDGVRCIGFPVDKSNSYYNGAGEGFITASREIERAYKEGLIPDKKGNIKDKLR